MALTAVTTAAYQDWFTRNILAIQTPGLAGEEGYETFTPNGGLVTWPDLNEAKTFIGGSPDTGFVQMALDAAIWRISERTQTNIHPVDPDTQVVDTATFGPVSPTIKFATLMQASRWYDRRKTPQGVLGSSEFVGVVRASALDPDVEALIGNDVVWGLA